MTLDVTAVLSCPGNPVDASRASPGRGGWNSYAQVREGWQGRNRYKDGRRANRSGDQRSRWLTHTHTHTHTYIHTHTHTHTHTHGRHNKQGTEQSGLCTRGGRPLGQLPPQLTVGRRHLGGGGTGGLQGGVQGGRMGGEVIGGAGPWGPP